MTTILKTVVRAIAACAVMTVALSTAARADNAGSIDVQNRKIEQFVLAKFMADPPDLGALEEFAKDLTLKTAKREVHEHSAGLFYTMIGMMCGNPIRAATLADWRAKHPSSSFAILGSIAGYKFAASGNLTLALTTRTAWQSPPGADKMLDYIRTELLNSKEAGSRDPYWYQMLVEASIALGRDQAEITALVYEGLKKHPANVALILSGTNAYLSKWTKDTKGLRDFANHVAEVSTPENRAANYARVHIAAQRAQYGAQLFKLVEVDWDRLMLSVRELIKKEPTNSNLNNAAIIACLGGNRSLTREILTHPGFEYNDFQWYDLGTSDKAYPYCRQWAAQQASNNHNRERPVPTANP